MILPVPAGPFEWIDAAGGPALVCRPLATIAVHAFTTRGWLSAADVEGDRSQGLDGGWEDVARTLGVQPADLLRVRQVHGTAVSVGRPAAGTRPEGDIVLARDEAFAVAVQVADCVPLLIADARTGSVAAVHAGWRGLAARAPGVAVHALATEYGSRPGDLVGAFGPSIGACCYEVGADVRDRFAGAGFATADLDRWFLERPPGSQRNPAIPGIASERREGRWYFDGWAAVRAQLEEAGVRPSQTFGPDLCTASHPGAFCSFRRDGVGAGRMAAAIRIGPPRP